MTNCRCYFYFACKPRDTMRNYHLKLRGKNIDIGVNGEQYQVIVDGKEFASNKGTPVVI
jgi:hypothetical protein